MGAAICIRNWNIFYFIPRGANPQTLLFTLPNNVYPYSYYFRVQMVDYC